MDLFKITKSKTREKILQLYFSDPERKYYLRQLEKLLNLPVGNVRRELLALEKSGLFNKEQAGNLVYYFLNTDSALFKDIKSIIFKTLGVEGVLKKELKKIKEINKAFIFGSFAKDKENTASDIDLMIIGHVDDNKLIVSISKLERVFNREINYHVFDEKEWQEKSKSDSFLKAVNKGLKIKII